MGEKGLLAIEFCDGDESELHIPVEFREVVKQLDEYFNNQRTQFDLKLDLQGTPFQVKVWNQLCMIPYGETISYKQLAENINNAKAIRAVGGANNKNKLPIVVPCHRVIGANGSLVGYAGGLQRKIWLLELEKEFHHVKT